MATLQWLMLFDADIHTATAAKVFDVSSDDVIKEIIDAYKKEFWML